MAKDIVLGSGVLYMTAFNSTTGVPDDEEIEVSGNVCGVVKGGASFQYTPTPYEVIDDFGRVIKRFITKEEVVFKSGIITFDMQTIANIAGAAAYTDDTVNHRRIVKIGGRGASGLTPYLFRFVHTDGAGLKTRCTVVGTNDKGFTFAWNPDKETQIDMEIKALPSDTDGTLVILDTEYSGS